MGTRMDLSRFQWLHKPSKFQIDNGALTVTTDPVTDFWQRTYYAFQHDNAHAFLLPVDEKEFSFTVRTVWEPKKLFDQCGVILYQDPDNWVKASVEYENEQYAHLGSVVTNLGYSDWATTQISSALHQMIYRLSRRGQDFLIENSENGEHFRQMRVLHMHQPISQARIGVYACSPLNSSIQVVFSDFVLGECLWKMYSNPDE
jgi:uncharacterized protein